VQPEAGLVPSDYRPRRNQYQRLLPSRPEPPQGDPEQLVLNGKSATRPLAAEGQQLLTESEILQHEVFTRAERTENPPEKVSKAREHGSMLWQRA
jgi:hypothetical protein